MPTDAVTDDLKKAMPHIAYEYRILNTAYRLALNAKDTPSFVVAFDSFLLHYRTLIEFFYSTSDRAKRSDDLRAGDYVPGWRTPSFPMWEQWNSRLHILLAHLSVKRIAVQEQQTGFDHRRDFGPMLAEIALAWNSFKGGGRWNGLRVLPGRRSDRLCFGFLAHVR